MLANQVSKRCDLRLSEKEKKEKENGNNCNGTKEDWGVAANDSFQNLLRNGFMNRPRNARRGPRKDLVGPSLATMHLADGVVILNRRDSRSTYKFAARDPRKSASQHAARGCARGARRLRTGRLPRRPPQRGCQQEQDRQGRAVPEDQHGEWGWSQVAARVLG